MCQRVLERWTPSAQSELMRLARRMATAAGPARRRRSASTDVRFHGTLWQLADPELLLEVAAGLRGRIERSLRAANCARARRAAPKAAQSHVRTRQLLALGRHDAVAAAMLATSCWAPGASRVRRIRLLTPV